MRKASTEEEDILQQSTKRCKEHHQNDGADTSTGGGGSTFTEEPKRSYRDTITGEGNGPDGQAAKEDLDGEISEDVEVEVGDKVPWLGMGMTKEEKIAARRPWRKSLIIKLVGRSIGYQYLYRRIQAVWRMQSESTLIDLSNDYFIVKLYGREEYERGLLDGPWMIGDNYLHVQRWRHNFRAEKEEINMLPVWFRFPILPVEYYSERWLKKVVNEIGRTIKVDLATLLASQGKFARVCVEIDL